MKLIVIDLEKDEILQISINNVDVYMETKETANNYLKKCKNQENKI